MAPKFTLPIEPNKWHLSPSDLTVLTSMDNPVAKVMPKDNTAPEAVACLVWGYELYMLAVQLHEFFAHDENVPADIADFVERAGNLEEGFDAVKEIVRLLTDQRAKLESNRHQ